MAKTSKKDEAQPKKQPRKDTGTSRKVWAVLFIIIIIIAISGALVYNINSTQPTNLGVFESNFDSASNVSIAVYANNNTELSVAIRCAATLIEQLAGTSGPAHRNPASITQFYMNSQVCSYGVVGANAINTTPADCLSISAAQPRILINYSSTNKTTITPKTLYVSGDAAYLNLCGVASEITNG